MKNAGIEPEQIADYIGLAGLGELQIEAAVRISLSEEEKQKFLNLLTLFQATSQEFAPEILPKINELFLAGKFAELNALIVASQPGVEKTALEFILGVYPDLGPVLAATQAQADAAPVAVPFVPKTQEFNDAIDYLRFTAQVAANANPIQVPVVSVFSEGGLFAPGGLLNPGAPAGGLQPFAPSGPPTTMGGFFGSGQYSGGAVSKGGRYEVNEGGREFFTPSSDGFIMNASDAKTLVQGVSQIVSGGGGGGMTNNITINETSSPRQTALEVIRANKASLFLAGAL